MHELVATSANLALAETNGGKLKGVAEVVLIVSEPRYMALPGGGFSKARTVGSLRFATDVAGLRDTAKGFTKMADELEALADRATLQPDDET